MFAPFFKQFLMRNTEKRYDSGRMLTIKFYSTEIFSVTRSILLFWVWVPYSEFKKLLDFEI